MEKIEDMLEDFKQAKIVMLTTFSETGDKRSRPMTNFNESPYEMIWFPTDRRTKKVEDIKRNSKVIISFPSSNNNEFYEIEGVAEFEDENTTAQKWRWWYLYWHPHQKNLFREPFPNARKRTDRMIININPKKAKIVRK